MRAGAYTVHQSLSAEAAAVLKLSLGLARRRGHAQVTPLHVAYTLLGVSEPSSSPRLFTTTTVAGASTPAYGLLMRACARSRSQSQTHPAQCRALELCFNVALNRLPTGNAGLGMGSSPSTSFAASLLQQPSPTLSNALVAALKRAQANQRRGCVELQSQPCASPPGPQPQSTTKVEQQPPMLTIKVELDQLIISILDDPSVSRVMREAGFSSAAVKTNLEEESAAMLLGLGSHHGSSTPSSSSHAPPAAAVVVPPHFFQLEPYGGFPAHAGASGALWAAPSLESESPCKAEDVRAILEVMLTRRQGRRRANPVVVGDSASVAEASVAELMRRMERGDVPDELRGARVLRLHLSHVHVRLMTRADVDAWAADLRRSVGAATGTDNTGAGLVIYVGDMRWAVDSSNDDARGFSPAAHLAAELARLLGELRLRAASHGHGGRAWLVAAASYGTFMRCQRSSLEVTWDLQPVSVPAGAGGGLDLELGPRAATASSPADGKAAHPAQFPLLDLAPKQDQEDGVPMPTLCAECAKYYENEASVVRAKAAGTNLALTFFPGWPQADEPQTSHKDDLMELKKKWSRLCQLRVHSQSQWNQPTRPCNANATTSNMNSVPWLSTCELLPPSGDLKRKAESVRMPSESKRWMGGGGGLDLNLRADDDEEDGGAGSSEDEFVPSDLTNDGEGPSGDVTDDSIDSHRHAAVTFDFDH
ncbi:protein SMAX1-LIKE 4-like isoform X1 [Miscanthus floridulus]|uniref:protein SMAX1-LIKE 4-like isoform X1 n=1 Tax=Miscanthus floridulus TaxID=154761 RepID=UPI003458719B